MKKATEVAQDRLYEVKDEEGCPAYWAIQTFRWELYLISDNYPNLVFVDGDQYRNDLFERHGIKISN